MSTLAAPFVLGAVLRFTVLPLALATLTTATTGAAQELRAEDIYARSAPSVVALDVETTTGQNLRGSGFLALREGIVVTAWHVVQSAVRVRARFSDGEITLVDGLIDRDPSRDLAVLHLASLQRPVLPLAQGQPRVGSKVYVLGRPEGLDFTLSDGLVSQLRNVEGNTQIQFSAPASPGSSGGPLLNARGEVIGVVSSQYVVGQNLNFASWMSAGHGLDIAGTVTRWGDVKTGESAAPRRTTQGNGSSGVRRSPKEILAAAKTILVRQTVGNPELLVAVEQALLEWGRLSVVSDAEDADLLLQLAPTADVSLLSGKGAKAVAIITDSSGMKLWSSVKGGDWSLSGLSYPKVGKAFIADLRKFIADTKR